MQVWFRLSEEEKQGLIALQDRLYPYIRLQPPVYEKRDITFDCLEEADELERIMKQKPRGRVAK